MEWVSKKQGLIIFCHASGGSEEAGLGQDVFSHIYPEVMAKDRSPNLR